MQKSLKILSRNIQNRDRIKGNKFDDEQFSKQITSNDIFCLQECRRNIKVPNFVCYNKQRSKSTGGGVCIGFSRHLLGGIRQYDIGNRVDLLAVVLNKQFFKVKRDILLINCYIPPSNSSYIKRLNIDPYEHLTSLLIEVGSKYEIILCGDFNSRSQSLSELLLCDNIPGLPDNDITNSHNDTIPLERNNKDTRSNAYTSTFMELVTQANLTILNGRCIGDIFGELTCITYNGASTVDYFITSNNLIHEAMCLTVGPFTEYSDHKSLTLIINISYNVDNIITDHNFDKMPQRYKWTEESKSKFLEAQQNHNIREEIKHMTELEINNKEDVANLNSKLTSIFHQVAKESLHQPDPTRRKTVAKHKWYDKECRAQKRKLNAALRGLNTHPNSLETKNFYFDAKKQYRSILRRKKYSFFTNLNHQLESTKKGSIDWKVLKKLKQHSNDDILFDDFDIDSFYNFFKTLYTDAQPISDAQRMDLKNKASDIDKNRIPDDSLENLNRQITKEELNHTIKKLSNGKSVSLDLISNEMLKNLSKETIDALLTLFNKCLEYGTYPWTSSTITPLHKGGDPYNPDNYRAIALGSCTGKLFSSILLERINIFRSENCPDHPNQLGFKKGAQTSDHILTLKTLIGKYALKHSTKIYSCFVDFRKAFDSVAREALIFKIAKLGIGGNIFKTLQHMYENTSTRIKLINKLSDHIKLTNGVEQGHPLSPELFKIFIHDLSAELNTVKAKTPQLNNINISHLFWADDLVLLGLSEESLQMLIDVLSKYCTTWGLTINPKNTKIMIFNKAGRHLQPKNNIILNDKPIESTKSYCYLGIVFVPSGKFKTAIEELKKKALRAFFKLKATVSRCELSLKALFKLFDALILPILAYGSQVLFSESQFVKAITTKTKLNKHTWQQDWLTLIAKDSFESMHLKFIKWVLGVHKKASNIGCWGESARLPIGIPLLKLFYNYAIRVSDADTTSLLHHTFAEQKLLQLPWYLKFIQINSAFSSPGKSSLQEDNNPSYILYKGSSTLFKTMWKSALSKSTKLSFYNKIKSQWGIEEYQTSLTFATRIHLTRIRISSHRLAIEQGRYSIPPIPREDRLCTYCLKENNKKTLGDEHHLIYECNINRPALHRVTNKVHSLLLSQDPEPLWKLDGKDLQSFATYIKQIYSSYLQYTSQSIPASS